MSETSPGNSLTQGVIWKKLLSFFFPILLGTLFQQLYNTVDAIIVGRFVGTFALAAVGGSAALIVNLLVGFFVGLSSGAMVIISQCYGAGDGDRLQNTLHTAVTFCILAGVGITALGLLFAPWALELVRCPADIMAESLAYLRIYFWGTVPLMLFNVGSGILRAMGDSKRPLYYLIICTLMNIALDLLFVTVFGLGVRGVGWATVIALIVSACLILYNLMHAEGPARLRLSRLKLHMDCLSHILRIGIPSGVQSTMYSLSNLIIQSSVNDLGSVVVAAWSTTGKLDSIFWAVSNSFGVAISAFVGQSFGAGLYDRMKKSVRVCLSMALGTTVVIATLLLTLGRYGFHVFTSDTAVINYSVEMLSYFAPFYVVWCFIEVISNTLRGAGDAFRPMLITMIGVCGLRILWCLFVVPHWHTIMGLSMCYPFTWSVTAIIFVLYYFKGNWLERCIRLRDAAAQPAEMENAAL